MSNNGKQNPFVPAGGGAWKKLGQPAQPNFNLSDKKLVLRQLTELFGKVIEQNVIETIANSCGWNVQQSIDALMEISKNVDVRSPSNSNTQWRDMKPRQSPSTAPALQAIKVAYEGYDDSSDDADVIIEDEEEVQIVQKVSPHIALPSSNVPRTQPPSKPAPKESKRGPVKSAQSLEIDVITESINRGIKIMVLMRGVPGSGKSFLARKLISDSLLDAQPDQFIFSSDDYFCQSGHYVFAPQKLPEAHEWNRMRVMAAMHRGMSPVIIDNTNTEAWEMKPYVHPAVHYGYAIEILEPTTPWCRKESELCRRNTHGVPRQNIRNMLERYEKTSVADMLLKFACSYTYGNTPPQACSNKPKLKAVRKTPRENGGRRKSASEPRENPAAGRPVAGNRTKNGVPQENMVLPIVSPPLPQRVPKQVVPTAVSVTALRKDVKAVALQKAATQPSELQADRRANKLTDTPPLDTRRANVDLNLNKPVSPALSDEDVLAKMKRELKATLRWTGPKEKSGDFVQEMFKEDVLVRLGLRSLQREDLSPSELMQANDQDVDQLVDEMWEHFVQLNSTGGADGDDAAAIGTEGGKGDDSSLSKDERLIETLAANQGDGAVILTEPEKDDGSSVVKVQQDSERLPAYEGIETEVETGSMKSSILVAKDQGDHEILDACDSDASVIAAELGMSNVCTLVEDQRECKTLAASDGVATETETESRKASSFVDVHGDCEALAATEDHEVSKVVAADLIENLIQSVDSVLSATEERKDPPVVTYGTEVSALNDATEQIAEFANVLNVPSVTEDVSLTAEYSPVDSVLSGPDSLSLADAKTESVNVAAGINHCFEKPLDNPPTAPATDSTNHASSINASGALLEGLASKSEPIKLAPKQSGLFSWLFPRKPAASPSVPAKVDFVLGFSDPTFTVYDQGVNCNPGKQVSGKAQDVSPVGIFDSKSIEVVDSSEISPEILKGVDLGDDVASSEQEVTKLADDEGLSLLLDAEDSVIEAAAECLTESLQKKSESTQIVSDALVHFEEEETAKDVLLSRLTPDDEDKVNVPFEIVLSTSTPVTVDHSEGLFITNQSIEPVPSKTLPGTAEKSEDLDQINQLVENSLPNPTTEKTDDLDKINMAGFTNPWAEVETKAKVSMSPPPPPLDSKPRKPKVMRDSATNTTHADFSAAFAERSVPSEATVVTARGRSINDDCAVPAANDEGRARPAVFSLDKGCMTSPVESGPRQHDFELLVNMFPRIGADDLREVFDKCRHEINWAVELLLESGYDFEPRDYVDAAFDVAQGLETTQHLLEELNTRDLGIIQEASAKRESSPQQEACSLSSESAKPEPPVSSPAARKSPKKPSQLTLALQRQVESSVQIGESFYSEHTLKLRRQRHGESEPGVEQAEPDSDPELMENEDEAVVPLTLDAEFLRQLQRLFGHLPFQYPDGVPPVVQLPVALARQIHGYLIESQQQQLDKQEEYFQNMIKDEEFARRLQEEEMPAPDLREIMDMELALELYRASQREPGPAQDDLATRLSRQKLLQQFPGVNRDVLAEVFAAHDYSFAETVAVIEASVKADGEPVKNVLSPEALLALEKQLIKQAKEESKKQSESCAGSATGGAGAGEWSTAGARETPAMDSARNFREEALRLVQLRSECFRKASDAHRNGQTAVASYYAQVGHLYKEHIEEANARAAAALLAANAEDRQSTTLDLHFLYVAEALQALDIFLDHHVAALAAGASDSRTLFIITGAGTHSAGGRARIKPAVERRLTQRKAKFVQVNNGMLKVTATKNMPLSSCL